MTNDNEIEISLFSEKRSEPIEQRRRRKTINKCSISCAVSTEMLESIENLCFQ